MRKILFTLILFASGFIQAQTFDFSCGPVEAVTTTIVHGAFEIDVHNETPETVTESSTVDDDALWYADDEVGFEEWLETQDWNGGTVAEARALIAAYIAQLDSSSSGKRSQVNSGKNTTPLVTAALNDLTDEFVSYEHVSSTKTSIFYTNGFPNIVNHQAFSLISEAPGDKQYTIQFTDTSINEDTVEVSINGVSTVYDESGFDLTGFSGLIRIEVSYSDEVGAEFTLFPFYWYINGQDSKEVSVVIEQEEGMYNIIPNQSTSNPLALAFIEIIESLAGDENNLESGLISETDLINFINRATILYRSHLLSIQEIADEGDTDDAGDNPG